MSVTLREGNLELTVPDGMQARRFDDAAHGLTHCMKAVDFIIELTDRILFVEFKDPEHPAAKDADRVRFIAKFHAGQLDADLVQKYRDSFLYEWAASQVGKPVYYYVLVAISSLDAAMLITRTDALKRDLPTDGPPSGDWKRRIVEDAAVFNIERWNNHLIALQVKRSAP